jgi:low affinity Fe/Cu permease
MITGTEQSAELPGLQIRDSSPAPGLAANFAHLANRTAVLAGNYKTFVLMLMVIIVWAFTGPIFGFSANWQLFINTGTTIVTFLMVFLIQNTQNRDSMAVHLKLDEIIRAIDEADDELMRAEDETDEELANLKKKFQQVMEDHRVIKQKIAERIDEKSR